MSWEKEKASAKQQLRRPRRTLETSSLAGIVCFLIVIRPMTWGRGGGGFDLKLRFYGIMTTWRRKMQLYLISILFTLHFHIPASGPALIETNAKAEVSDMCLKLGDQ